MSRAPRSVPWKVFWDEVSKRWVMVIAAFDHVRFYGSDDTRHWELQNCLRSRNGLKSIPKTKNMNSEKWACRVWKSLMDPVAYFCPYLVLPSCHIVKNPKISDGLCFKYIPYIFPINPFKGCLWSTDPRSMAHEIWHFRKLPPT